MSYVSVGFKCFITLQICFNFSLFSLNEIFVVSKLALLIISRKSSLTSYAPANHGFFFLVFLTLFVVLRHLLKESDFCWCRFLFSQPYGWETIIIRFYFGMLYAAPSSETVGFVCVGLGFPVPRTAGDRY